MSRGPSRPRSRRASWTDRAAVAFRTRTAPGRALSARLEELRHRRIPLHATGLFAVVSAAALAVLLVSGVVLMFFYTPSSDPVVYRGSYPLLAGVEVSKAFASTMAISYEVGGGLLVRQAHHWAALLLPASLILQVLVMFFTGGFRRPRQWSWVLLFLLLIVALVGGWSGYALPDDMLSGSGLRIVQGIVLAIPVVGTWVSALLFGGEFPGTIIENLYPIHVAIVPALLIVLVLALVRLWYVHQPAQFAGPGRTEENVVGVPFANAAVRATGLFAIVCGILLLVSATVTISPIWLYGPSSPGDASAGSQPDWYTGFLDGALRLVPPRWEVELFGHTWSIALLAPLLVVSVFLLAVAVYPFVENWASGDHRDHHLLDRPRNAPTRTAIGVAGIVFYGVLWGSASADLVATHFHLTIEGVIHVLQIILLIGPAIGFGITRSVCAALQRRDQEMALHGFETGQILRLPGGEYVEVHQQLDRYTRWTLLQQDRPAAYAPRPDDRGRLHVTSRIRGAISRWMLEDRIAPIAQESKETIAELGGRSKDVPAPGLVELRRPHTHSGS